MEVVFENFRVAFRNEFKLIEIWGGTSDTGVVEILFNFGEGVFRGEPNQFGAARKLFFG